MTLRYNLLQNLLKALSELAELSNAGTLHLSRRSLSQFQLPFQICWLPTALSDPSCSSPIFAPCSCSGTSQTMD